MPFNFRDFRITVDMVCALFLGVALIIALYMGDNNNAGIITGALSGYMGRALANNPK